LRRVAGIVAAALVIVVGVLWWKHGGDHGTAPRAATSTAVPSSKAPAAARAPTLTNADGTDPAAEPRPQPVPVDPATAPSLDAPVSKPAPPQKPLDRSETLAKREADLKLLDDTRTRLEKELASAQAAGDATAVHDLQIRITRTTELRKQRSGELDKLRAGGELPK
jgi:type IV secretory pathway VirB10-like protein